MLLDMNCVRFLQAQLDSVHFLADIRIGPTQTSQDLLSALVLLPKQPAWSPTCVQETRRAGWGVGGGGGGVNLLLYIATFVKKST